MRIAFLADIHSNLPALEAVLADLQITSPDLVFLGGDQVNRCPWPNEVMEVLNEQAWPAIYGNHEIILLNLNSPQRATVYEERQRFADLWWTLGELRPEYLEEMRHLPAERRIALEGAPPIRLLHGLPGNPFEGFNPEMSDTQLRAKASEIAEPVIVTAHTHKAMVRTVGDQWILNPGSVGMPYNGDPRAQYMLLDLVDGVWQPTFCQVDYDHSVIREAFDRLGLFKAYGPLGPLFWQTIATGDPWVSDFQVWVREQAPIVRADLTHAVELYLSTHGPGRWAFNPV